ncbi:hypothetical protein C8R48DRAFT_774810 [Suillus tomentosus]|nr:hypothetical protein C8R48DRAFT_774810 [Suillus tomentosus]
MSTTHLLNIFTIVPPELLPAMSSHLITNPEPSPIIFHIPDFYTLHRITDYAQHVPSTTSPTSLMVSRKAHSRRSNQIPLIPSIPTHSSSPEQILHTPPFLIPLTPAFHICPVQTQHPMILIFPDLCEFTLS